MCTKPNAVMGVFQRKLIYNYKYWACVIALVVGMFGCGKPTTKGVSDPAVDSVLEFAKVSIGKIGADRVEYVIDSMLAGRDLSPVDNYRVLSRKYTVAHEMQREFGKSYELADSILNLINENPGEFDTGTIFTTYMWKGNSAYSLGRYAEAFRYYELAEELAVGTKSPCREFIYMYRIGMSNYGEGRYAEAVRLFKSAHENLIICGEVSVEKDVRNQEILSDIGLAYVGAGMPDSSVSYFQRAISFVSEKKNAGRGDSYKWNEALSVAMGNLGDAYSKLGKTDSAEWYFKESIALSAHGNRNLQDELYNRLKLADLYVKVGRAKEAFELLQRVDEMMVDTAQVNRSCDVTELMMRRAGVRVRYYQSLGASDEAFEAEKRYDSMQELKWARTKQLLNNSIAQGLDNAHHEKQILLLEKDMQIKGQQNVILVLAVVLAILAIIVIVRLLKDYRKHNAELKVEAEEITRTSAEKEAMLQQKIRTDELNFMALIENTDDVLWSVDRSGALLAFNKAFRDMVLREPGEAPSVGQRFPGSVTEMTLAGTIEQGYKNVLGSGSFDAVEKVAVSDTVSTHIQLRFKAIKNEAGVVTGVSCFLRDITKYVKMIESLEEKNQRLRDIAWVQSHKLRGPLTTVMSILEFLEGDDATHEQKKEMLAGLQAKVAEMDAIIHEIVSKTE